MIIDELYIPEQPGTVWFGPSASKIAILLHLNYPAT